MEKAQSPQAPNQSSFLDRWADEVLAAQPLSTPDNNRVTQTTGVPTTPPHVAPAPTTPPPATPTAATQPAQGNVMRDYHDLQNFAEGRNFTVTSTTGGRHNAGSVHGSGCAVDVRTRDRTTQEVDQLIEDARGEGITVRDERTQPAGQAVWSGPHVHLQIPPANRQADGTCFEPQPATPQPAQAPAPAQGPVIRP
ncbi:MAG: hypothetical protein R3F23_05135 [Verrucomicrobiia bacterium]